MFNNYSKITTAFAAFALLFSTGAWSQCDEGLISVDFVLNAGAFPGEVSWTLNDADGTPIIFGDIGEGSTTSSECLPPGDYTFIGSDSYGDGWNGGFATFSVGGSVIALFELLASDDGSAVYVDVLTFTVSADIPGCTDITASNFNDVATVDDGTCCFDDYVTIILMDSWGDGWSLGGGLEFSGAFYEFASGTSLSLNFCLAPGCYNGTLTLDNWPSEASWDVLVNGVEVATGSGASTDLFFSSDPACIVAGCNDEMACNFVPSANVNDGSCEFSTCAGCTELGACNYDVTATFDDSSCDYSCIGCMDATANNYDADASEACEDCCTYCELTQYEFSIADSYGDGICCSYGDGSYTVTADGEVIASGGDWEGTELQSTVFCVSAEACLVVTVLTDQYSGETSWTLSANGEVVGENEAMLPNTLYTTPFGACTSGCSDAGACNYVEPVDLDDGTCDYTCVGCMDSSAANFDPNATIDSGLCVYCDPGTFVLTLDMSDSFGDGWNGAVYYVYDQTSGEQVYSGDLDSAFSGDGLSQGTDMVCLAPGCYNVQVSSGASVGEVSISMSDQFGTNYGSTGGDSIWPLDFTLTGACAFSGCTSASALNYNISASDDDGSCLEPPANDLIVNAEALACDAYVNGSLLFSSDDEGLIGSDFAGNVVNSAGVWYVINAASDQQVTVSTCDTPTNDATTDYTADTKLHVYTQAVDGSLVAMASNDDGCDVGYLSSATFNVSTGLDYYILISEYSAFTNGNDFVVSVACAECADVPSNDDCSDATALVSGETYVGSTCCASQEGLDIPWAGFSTAYGVWFTFNSGDFDTFDFDATNLTNDGLGLGFMGSGDCATLSAVAGCSFTGSCAGSVEAFIDLEPNTDYYAVIWTTDLNTCGDFEFTTTGISFGCTDVAANNYDDTATTDDGTCDFEGVVPANDICDNALALDCNTLTVGSTGGSSILGSPIGVLGCETAPGAGVWYSFVGDGQLHNLSTCGSDIDSKINIYTADVACGGGGIDVPPADACGEGLVTIGYSAGGGSYLSEISFEIYDADLVLVASGAAGTDSDCLLEGDYTVALYDSYGDGWNGSNVTFTNGLGEVVGFFGMESDSYIEYSMSVSAYSMEPVYQPGDFTCFASAATSDGTGTCTLFDSDDVNFEFISTVGTLYYVLVGSEGASGAFDLEFNCATVVEGCMNSAACNYDELANVSAEDTCDFWSCVCATETGSAVQLNMIDAFGDGWNGAGYTISDLSGNILFEGGLDDAQFSVDEDNYAGPEFGFDLLCLEPGCYNISVSTGDWASEVSWNIAAEDGTLIVSGGAPDSQTISVGGAVCGCTEAGACNYDEIATDDDGSCEYETCAGCTDEASCSYDADSTIDDGSCCYDECLTVSMFDSLGDGWNGAIYTLSTVDGVEIGTGTIDLGQIGYDSYCLADGCYTISVGGGTWDSEISWSVDGFGVVTSGFAPGEATFNVGSGDQCIAGCDISCACNYDAAANIQDLDQCVFSGCEGCTYPDATNYDATAIADDGLCQFDIANACPADLNDDGSITTGDLLIFLGAFGTICEG